MSRLRDVAVNARRRLSAVAVVALSMLAECWVGSAASHAASTGSSTREELQAFTELVAVEFEERGLRLVPIVVLVGPLVGRHALTAPINDDLEIVSTGPIDQCAITYAPDAVDWFDRREDDSAALKAISTLAAHELVHCFQFAVAGEARRARLTPDWVDEGAGDWAAFTIVSPGSPAPSALSEWGEFFTPGVDLFGRGYDAVGFWSAVQRQGSEANAWQLLRYALALPWETAASSEETDPVIAELSRAVLRRASGDDWFLARWAMSFLRRPEFGPEWETTGPGLGNERPPDAPILFLVPGARVVPAGHVRGFAYADFEITEGVEVIRVSPRGYGALHWGRHDNGPDDLFTGLATAQFARFYCLREDGCPCPSGMRPKQGRDLPVRPFDAVTLAFFGDYEAAPGSLQPQVEVIAYSMADATNQLCEPDVDLDLTVCDTWASHEELLALVPGGTSVTGPQDVGTEGGPWACLWTVVGPPLEDPMFFEWTVDVWPFVVVRAGQSDEEWNALVGRVEREKGCTPEPLGADRVPACVSRSDDSMDVVVRLGADRLLWLRLDTLNYPMPDFHSAGEQLALFLAARLAT
jgi:hypothetical protein